MEDISIVKAVPEPNTRNIIRASFFCEADCKALDDEYSISIEGVIGRLEADFYCDDFDLVKEAIHNNLNLKEMKTDERQHIVFTLSESGEWEDVFWNKYYVVIGKEIID